jgi:hypothetical protein
VSEGPLFSTFLSGVEVGILTMFVVWIPATVVHVIRKVIGA